jgi:hypothetical protein
MKEHQMLCVINFSGGLQSINDRVANGDLSAPMPAGQPAITEAVSVSQAKGQVSTIGVGVKLRNCSCCNVAPGQLHVQGCDNETSPYCGGRLLWCNCEEYYSLTFGGGDLTDEERVPWRGERQGIAECREFGWFVRKGVNGWERCSAGDPKARPDIMRLKSEAKWNRTQKRWVLLESVGNAGRKSVG